MNEKVLKKAIEDFKQKLETMPAHFAEEWEAREDRRETYSSYEAEDLMSFNKEEFAEYLAKLWSMFMWGDKIKHATKIIDDNGLTKIKKHTVDLLYGKGNICDRWDEYASEIKGIGPATMSELLSYIDPDSYAIMNNVSINCLRYLGVEGMPKYTYQYTSGKFLEICEASEIIAKHMRKAGIEDADLLTVDYLLWDEIRPLVDSSVQPPVEDSKPSEKDSKSLHDELRDKIVDIGQYLGFNASPEVKVAEGAVVDAVWEAQIGNMGKVIYVFEVQSKGSIDSLILNLKKAQSNAAVQAIVAVSDEAQLNKILTESKGVITSGLRTWESDDVLAVHDALTRAHESINKLALVPESF